jgi:CheY-like chemotaxis protein
MPKIEGTLRVRHIEQAHPGIPLIAISGQFRSGLSAAGAAAQSLGVQQVIAKPLVHRDLLAAVRGIIGEPI